VTPVNEAEMTLEPGDLVVTPAATDDELAAILAAYEALWPKTGEATMPAPAPRWRYAGRSWVARPHYGGWR